MFLIENAIDASGFPPLFICSLIELRMGSSIKVGRKGNSVDKREYFGPFTVASFQYVKVLYYYTPAGVFLL